MKCAAFEEKLVREIAESSRLEDYYQGKRQAYQQALKDFLETPLEG